MILTMAKPWLSECSTLPFALWFIKLNWLTRYGFTEHRVFRIWYICMCSYRARVCTTFNRKRIGFYPRAWHQLIPMYWYIVKVSPLLYPQFVYRKPMDRTKLWSIQTSIKLMAHLSAFENPMEAMGSYSWFLIRHPWLRKK